MSVVSTDSVTDSLEQFWELESLTIRILDKGDAHMTLKEEESFSQFNEGLKHRCCRKVMLITEAKLLPGGQET